MTVAGHVGGQWLKFALRMFFAAPTTRVSNALNRFSGVLPCTCLIHSARVDAFALIWVTQVTFVCKLIHLAGLVLAFTLLNLRLTARRNGAVNTRVPTDTSKQWQEKDRVSATTPHVTKGV